MKYYGQAILDAEYSCIDRECVVIKDRHSFTRIQTSKGFSPTDQWARRFIQAVRDMKKDEK